MAYWKNSAKNIRLLDSYGIATNHTAGRGGNREYHELELGIVLDIVLDLQHPIFSGAHAQQTRIDDKRWPVDLVDAPPSNEDPDLTWIGRCLVRPLISGKLTEKDQLKWAYPLENNFSEYPLINETVILYEHENGKLYYGRKVNFRNWPNNNLDFSIEGATSGDSTTELFSKSAYTGRIETETNWLADSGYHGYAGKYFYGSPKMRTIRRFEGDLLVESRFGSELIMKAFDKNRDNDVGDPKYPDYENSGNPMIILRNRQRQLLQVGQTLSLKHSPNPATVVGTIEEKNVGGYLEENINHDGSSIYLTCGQTISEWVTTCFKRMFHDEKDEEVTKFRGPSSFIYPNPMKGDQIVINSDRLVLSARYEEILSYSKKRYGICTDSEFTVDAHQQMVLSTHSKIVLNSPAIYLGEYDNTDEPVLLGQTTVNLIWEFLELFKNHVHKHEHSHVDAGEPSPHMTQEPTNPFILQATALQVKLKSLLSRRVYVTGGGFSPGQNGASIPEGTPPVEIDVVSGAGVPGGFKGQSYRIGAAEASAMYGGAIESTFGPGGIASDTPPSSPQSGPDAPTPSSETTSPSQDTIPPNEEQKVKALKELPAEQKAILAKGGGCGGRAARKVGIFAPPDGSTPVTSSAEVEKWDLRNALLAKAGIIESDGKPPPEINVEDWKKVVAKFI